MYSFDEAVSVLEDTEHLFKVANHAAVIFPGDLYMHNDSGVPNHSDVISCGDSDGFLELGILGEILGPEGIYLDTDSEYEYDEDYETFVKISRFEPEESFTSNNLRLCQIDIFYSSGSPSRNAQEDGFENQSFLVSLYSLE